MPSNNSNMMSGSSITPGRAWIRLVLSLCVVLNLTVILLHFHNVHVIVLPKEDIKSVLAAVMTMDSAETLIAQQQQQQQQQAAVEAAAAASEVVPVERSANLPPKEKSQQDQRPETKQMTEQATLSQQQNPQCKLKILKSKDSIFGVNLTAYETAVSKEDTSASLSSSCTHYNTQAWLQGPRLSNARDDSRLTDAIIQRMIVDSPYILINDLSKTATTTAHSTSVLGTSICQAQSRFLNETETSTDAKSIRLWSVRLIYLALHYHQHHAAIPEAQARYAAAAANHSDIACPQQLEKDHSIGKMDYECGPDAKFLLISLSGNGLGANVRGSIVATFLAGLSTNRVVLVVNNAPTGDRYLRNPWPLVSCDRHDYQCFFMPLTPCTITHDELENAYVMTKAEGRALLNKGVQPVGHEHDRVIKFNAPIVPRNDVHSSVRQRLWEYAHALIDQVPCDDLRLSAMRQGADLILKREDPRDGYNYAAAAQKIQHAIAFYFMRPSLDNAHKIDEILNEVLPTGLDAERSVGLPIRASDKCKGESECLSFDQHMQVTSSLWSKHRETLNVDITDVNVVFTTESKSMVQEQKDFAANMTLRNKYPYSFNFVTNTKDVTPDTGFIKEVQGHKETASDALLSSMSSFKAQLMPRVSVGNCCSNFHALLNDFLMEGCGAASENTFLCLQEYEDPLLRVCCGWHHKCKKDKEAYITKLEKELESPR